MINVLYFVVYNYWYWVVVKSPPQCEMVIFFVVLNIIMNTIISGTKTVNGS